MSITYTCSQGHEWQSDEPGGVATLSAQRCPKCAQPPRSWANADPRASTVNSRIADSDRTSDYVPAPEPKPEPPPEIPGYEIIRELGRGGMGVVYLAKQLRLKRIVAVKMIRGRGASAREVQRFITEANAVAHLQHPSIVQIFEIGEVDGSPYFTLEYVGGGSLDRVVRNHPMTAKAAAKMAEQLADAIHYAHEQNIVHRDLKPANIFNHPLQGRDLRLV